MTTLYYQPLLRYSFQLLPRLDRQEKSYRYAFNEDLEKFARDLRMRTDRPWTRIRITNETGAEFNEAFYHGERADRHFVIELSLEKYHKDHRAVLDEQDKRRFGRNLVADLEGAKKQMAISANYLYWKIMKAIKKHEGGK